MSERSSVRARFAIACAGMLVFGATFTVACNALVGIQDVKLKRDAGGGDEEEPFPEEDSDIPVDSSAPIENILEVALGEQHSCARKPEGTVKCWGDDRSGQNGAGGSVDGGLRSEPADVMGITDAIDIASGLKHTCIVHQGGKVSCWGFNNDGQLGNGQTGTSSPAPVEALSIVDAVNVGAGSNFTCAARRGGGAACWGANNAGQLGTNNNSPSPAPISVTNLKDVATVAAGQLHACAAKRDGAVFCWGEGGNGQLGNGGTSDSPTPVQVASLPESTMVALTERSTCALTRMSTVLCWGANEVGQLGNGAANSSPNPSPILVSTLNDAIAIAAGKNHVCAARRGGTVVCWGGGSSGQLGDGQSRPDASTPTASFVTVSSITNAIGVGAGANHSCAPTKIGGIQCWGANDRGQLGNRAQIPELSPVSVVGYP
jgi:alpha-tubulin suppressor-like RCC1 family protein